MAEAGATRRDLESIRRQVRDLSARVERMDREGTRGMVRLSQEVGELGRDVAAFRTSHERAHEREIELRRSRTRWVITVLIAGLAAVEAPLAYLVAHIH